MVQIKVLIGGMVQALNAVKLVGEAGKAVNGPLATFGSTLPYARFIETGRSSRQVRRAGPAHNFTDGIKVAAAAAPALLLAAIPKGAASVGQAKRKIRDVGLAEIKKRTPVRSGALRDSVRVLERGGI